MLSPPLHSPEKARLLASVALEEDPIDARLVVSGNPLRRAKRLHRDVHLPRLRRRHDATVWECTAGCFRHEVEDEEFVQVIAGSVQVLSENGPTRNLVAGDIAVLSAQTSFLVYVQNHVRIYSVRAVPGDRLISRLAFLPRALLLRIGSLWSSKMTALVISVPL